MLLVKLSKYLNREYFLYGFFGDIDKYCIVLVLIYEYVNCKS